MSIYRSYPVDLYQQQLIKDIEHHLFKPEQSRLLDALISIESVPFPNPLIFLSQPSPFQQHSVNIPTQNLRKFSFQMPSFPSFEQSFRPSFGMFPQTGGFPSFPQIGGFPSFPQNGGFPSFQQNGGFTSFPSMSEFAFPAMDNIVVPDMNSFFKNQFDSKTFIPAIVQDAMKDVVRYGYCYGCIQMKRGWGGLVVNPQSFYTYLHLESFLNFPVYYK